MRMSKIIKMVLVLIASLLLTTLINAETKQEKAKALVEKASAHISKVGLDKANKDFTAKDGGFIEGELYIFCLQFDGLMLAHGGNPKLVTKNIYKLKDPDGKLFIHEFTDVAKTKGSGWVDYKWRNTVSKKVEPKSSYILRVKGKDVYIGCGFYK